MEQVRKLELDDIEQILQLRIGIQNYDAKFEIQNCDEDFMDYNKTILKEEELIRCTKRYIIDNLNKNIYMFGLFINDELIANCGFYIDRHFPTYTNKTGMTGHICNVFTKEQYRNLGYQKKVFNFCFDFAKEMGITNFILSSVNPKAIKMYKAFGFKENNHIYSYKI